MAITLSLPLVFLLLAEGILRLAGQGGYPPFFRQAGTLPSGERVTLVEPAASKPYFFANPTRPGYAEETNFLMPKPADTVRIFIVGESAAKGFPQPRNLTTASFLQAMLTDAWPDRRVEVISLGTTAVASFPLVYLVRDAVQYDPDLVIFYVGNNEFFGAYGVASINASGTLPTWALPFVRWARGLALVQAAEGLIHRKADESRTLMEEMVGKTVIPADSPLRAAAARNLETHLDRMLETVRAAGLPAVVCTTASNEAGLRPLGEGGGAKATFERAEQAVIDGDRGAAREAFLEARDRDTMPWRPIAATEEAIRRAATAAGAPLCDVAERFREVSESGATGWDLLDDHVHLSLKGQAEVARLMVGELVDFPPPLHVTPEAVASLPGWRVYAEQLGANEYDVYRVHHTMRTLFSVPFMKRSNPEAFRRFQTACQEAEQAMPPTILEAARQWQTFRPHAGGLRPLTGMVARALLRQNKPAEAEPLYSIAQRQVPDYTSWYLEYVYFALACREKIHGTLTEADRELAAAAISQGEFLLRNGFSESGLTERYVGRLHQLRDEWRESIEPLLAARPRMRGPDLVACDQALFEAYRRTGNLPAARELVERGIRGAGEFATAYRAMAAILKLPVEGD
jgi:lysophospholipase L1-like esterase